MPLIPSKKAGLQSLHIQPHSFANRRAGSDSLSVVLGGRFASFPSRKYPHRLGIVYTCKPLAGRQRHDEWQGSVRAECSASVLKMNSELPNGSDVTLLPTFIRQCKRRMRLAPLHFQNPSKRVGLSKFNSNSLARNVSAASPTRFRDLAEILKVASSSDPFRSGCCCCCCSTIDILSCHTHLSILSCYLGSPQAHPKLHRR